MAVARFLFLLPLLSIAMPTPAAHAANGMPDSAEVDVIKTRPDPDRRMTVPVRIGDSGPFHFVIDTGSQTSVMSIGLASRLAIPAARRARIIGMGGIEVVDTAIVDRMGLGRRSLDRMEMALLKEENIGAEGIVGVDSLQQQRVLLDFDRNTMSVGSARSLGGNSGFEIVVTARRRLGQLIITNAEIDGIHTDIIIDTGADTSVGNRALQRALSRKKSFQTIKLRSVTGHEVIADIGFPKKLTIQEVNITNLFVAYANSPVFDVLELNRRPAMMLGMRELRLFKRIAIDFEKRKVYFDLPKED